MQPVKYIVDAYNKIFGVIDNQILLLKYEVFFSAERRQGVVWKEVHRNSILTNFFEPNTIATIEQAYMLLKYQEGLLWIIMLTLETAMFFLT